MKKSDLKTGYLLETRNKTKLTVMLDTEKGDILLNECGTYYNINEISNDLFDIDLRDYDIMKVYRPKVKMVLFDVEEYELIWQREDNLKLIEKQLDAISAIFKVKSCDIIGNVNKEYEITVELENGLKVEIKISDEVVERYGKEYYIFNQIHCAISQSIRHSRQNKK